MPDAIALASLIALRPVLAKVQSTQESQERELEELRDRSATVLAQWYEKQVLQGGEQWSEWEERMASMEQDLRRRERNRSMDETEI